MRVGLISADFAPNIGGVAAHVAELGRFLAALGIEVHVISPTRGGRPGVERWRGMVVHRLRAPGPKPLFTYVLRRWLCRFLEAEPLDLVHLHGLRPLDATRHLSIPVVFTNHTSGFLQRVARGKHARRRVGRQITHVKHVLAPSRELAEATRAVGYTGPVEYVPNGVDTDRFRPGSSGLRSEWGVRTEALVLLARRLVEKNGCMDFAVAARQLTGLPVRLVIAGHGPDRARIESALHASKMLGRTLFLGAVPNDEMPEVYRAVDISVLPSWQEATSIAGLESMASGLPLVGTRVGGIPELIVDGQSGLLVPSRDPSRLGTAIRELVCSSERRERMGISARARALDRFSWRSVANEVAEIYARYAAAK